MIFCALSIARSDRRWAIKRKLKLNSAHHELEVLCALSMPLRVGVGIADGVSRVHNGRRIGGWAERMENPEQITTAIE